MVIIYHNIIIYDIVLYTFLKNIIQLHSNLIQNHKLFGLCYYTLLYILFEYSNIILYSVLIATNTSSYITVLKI